MSSADLPGTPEPEDHEEALHQLSDDDYFDSLTAMPPVLDAEGKPVTGLFDDVVDARESKARAAAAAAEKEGNA